MAHHVKIKHVRLRTYHALNACDTLHGIGYRAECDCGLRSRILGTVKDARYALRELHRHVQ